jgi:predicted Zn-ribbon and HTH transcriptional regulator
MFPSMAKPPPIPRESAATPRQAIRELLLEAAYSALELSQLLSLPEKEVLEHLAHIARAPGPGLFFRITPAACKHCGFTFKKRERLTTPSRCPRCRGESLRRPRFALVGK